MSATPMVLMATAVIGLGLLIGLSTTPVPTRTASVARDYQFEHDKMHAQNIDGLYVTPLHVK